MFTMCQTITWTRFVFVRQWQKVLNILLYGIVPSAAVINVKVYWGSDTRQVCCAASEFCSTNVSISVAASPHSSPATKIFHPTQTYIYRQVLTECRRLFSYIFHNDQHFIICVYTYIISPRSFLSAFRFKHALFRENTTFTSIIFCLNWKTHTLVTRTIVFKQYIL